MQPTHTDDTCISKWQTKQRGKLEDEYQLYRTLADDGTGHDLATGAPLLTFDEWLQK